MGCAFLEDTYSVLYPPLQWLIALYMRLISLIYCATLM